jgi:transposase
MANAYSTDLRERVVLTINEGASCHESAEIHRVSVSSAIRWYQSWRCSGSVEAKPSGGSH